jgi:flagellar motor protein MotB
MVQGGVDPLKLDAEGFSYSKLLDSRNNPQAWAKNRRVEIVFDGVTENDELKCILEPLMESP